MAPGLSKPQQVILIVGPTGVGKSTLFNVLSGVLPSDVLAAKESSSFVSCTKDHQIKDFKLANGFLVRLVDTIGFSLTAFVHF